MLGLREGDLAIVESHDEWIFAVTVPDDGYFYAIGKAIMFGQGRISLFRDNIVIAMQFVDDFPQYNSMAAYARIKEEPGTIVTISMKVEGLWEDKPILLITKNPPGEL